MTAAKKIERVIQAEIERAIGAQPDVILMRNALYSGPVGGGRWVNAGLGEGTPDLVAILAPSGRWFCLEVKQPGEYADQVQRHVHDVWRRAGAFVCVVRSVDDAIGALERARRGESQ